ncbi:hypothetical protein PIB30_094193 [Stylosanthes scabra]|uniref:Uncharacterized protein n=1 Tax=Stylosanthes scabra TaxID=79078 RepID=A0ABU6YSZ3_9FABA|nr:hypothetical protein [Stylosanthes scabra]
MISGVALVTTRSAAFTDSSVGFITVTWGKATDGHRLLGIEKDIGKAKEGIGSKRITRGSQKVRNRAPCGRTISSCDLTCPWERFGMHSANTWATAQVKTQGYIFVDCATAWYRLTESKLRPKLEF